MALDGFSALQFVPPAPKVLAEIKTTVLYKAFCSLILRLELSQNAVQTSFSMTWLRWLSLCIIF